MKKIVPISLSSVFSPVFNNNNATAGNLIFFAHTIYIWEIPSTQIQISQKT